MQAKSSVLHGIFGVAEKGVARTGRQVYSNEKRGTYFEHKVQITTRTNSQAKQ